MPKFRKKVVVIEAEQFFAGKAKKTRGICDNPKCFINLDHHSPHVHTIHNNQPVQVEDGDWIIPEPNGTNFYPCKPDIFANTYESDDVLNIPMIPCDSSAVSAFGYDRKLKILAVEYSKGGLYHYPDYSFSDFEKLRRAESVGKFVIANVQKLAHVKIS